MPREKKYTKTIAFRVTGEEWELIATGMQVDNISTPSKFIRKELDLTFKTLRLIKEQDAKREAAAAKRAAKKQANNAPA
jgi:hypothetical protein